MSRAAQHPEVARTGLATRLHRALMPDYNRRATAYWWVLVLLGALVMASALVELSRAGPDAWLRIGAGCVAVAVAALFPIRIPRTTITFAAGEAFIFLLLLLYGPAAATLAAACEATVGASRSSRRWTSRIASPAIAAIAMAAVGEAFRRAMSAVGQQALQFVPVATSLFAAVYGLSASVLVALVPLLKRDGPLAWRELVHSAGTFGGVAAMHAGSALLGGLLYLAGNQYGEGFLLQGVVIVTLMLMTMHYYLQQQAADSAARRSLLEATESAARDARRHAEELADSQALFRGAFVDAGIAMALLDRDGTIRQANAALCDLLHLKLERVVDAPFARFVDDSLESASVSSRLRAAVAVSPEMLSGEFFLRCADGRRIRVSSRCSQLKRPAGVQPRLIVQLQDITVAHRAESELRRMAHEDALTGLPNRRWLLEYLDVLAGQSQRRTRGHHALLLLDLDRFKLVNDTLGHDRGDRYLRLLAERIRGHLGPADHLARLGGDEFGVVLVGVQDESAAVETARRLAVAIAEPMRLGDELLHPSASIGVALGGAGVRAQDLLRKADIAMYQAKRRGGHGAATFDSQQQGAARARLRRERELRDALVGKGLRLAYQPLCSMAGEVVGFEALVRWTLPDGEVVEPPDIISLAEEVGLILNLTDFVLGEASRQFRLWLDANPAWVCVRLHINVSGEDLVCGTLAARVERALAAAALEPRQLAVELTENLVMGHYDEAVRTLQRLRDMGVRVCIDDFGTGYSSLSWLSRLPVDCIKIDRSFVLGLGRGSQDAEVVRAVIGLGKALDKDIVAEGIETQSQLDALVQLGCAFGQGHLFAPPLEASQIATRFLPAPASLATMAADTGHPVHGPAALPPE